MKINKILKTSSLKQALTVAALLAMSLSHSVPAQATTAGEFPAAGSDDASLYDHLRPGSGFSSILFAESPACRSAVYDTAAKFSSCNLKTEAKAAKRGDTPNFAACEAKMTRWAKKTGKVCCSDSLRDPEEHAACTDAVDAAVIDVSGGSGSCESGGDNPGLGLKWSMGFDCGFLNSNVSNMVKDCCEASGCEVKNGRIAEYGGEDQQCIEQLCDCDNGQIDWAYDDYAFLGCVQAAGQLGSIAPAVTEPDPLDF